MSVKNIFFTDDNQLDFKIGNEDVSKIFCGDVLVWERGENDSRGDRIEYVKGFASPVNGKLVTTEYTEDYPSSMYEIEYINMPYGNGEISFKPREEALCLLFVTPNAADFPSFQNMMEKQGWTLVDSIGINNSTNDSNPPAAYGQIYSKFSDGGTVGVTWDRNVYNASCCVIAALYGARSVNVVESDHNELLTKSWVELGDNSNTYYYWSGYSIPAPTTHTRIIVTNIKGVYGYSEYLSDVGFNAGGGMPSRYDTLLSTSNNIPKIFIDTSANSGLYMYVDRFSASSEQRNYNIYNRIGRNQVASQVLDIIY